jgi:very-short-patch-repair endonuclease
METKFGNGWLAVAEVARGQRGLITVAQLRACGISHSSIEKAVRSGRLHRLHQGVYAVGHRALVREDHWLAAVLACGADAVLSHRCAATGWGIRDGVGPLIDVTIRSGGRRRPGITIHRCRLEPYELARHLDIPITSPARTMVDLAHELEDPDDVAWALRELQFRRLFDRTAVELSNRRRPNAVLTRLLADLPQVRSRLELAFLSRVVRRHGLPEPECQAAVEGFHVDFLWPNARLVVETDGSEHDFPSMRATDTARDAILQGAGHHVLRYRWSDVHRHDRRTARQILAAIAE